MSPEVGRSCQLATSVGLLVLVLALSGCVPRAADAPSAGNEGLAREVGLYLDSIEGVRGPDRVTVEGRTVTAWYRATPTDDEVRDVADETGIAIDDLVGAEGWTVEVRTGPGGVLVMQKWMNPIARPGDRMQLVGSLRVTVPARWGGEWTRMHAGVVQGRTLLLTLSESDIDDASLTSSMTVEAFDALESMRAASLTLDSRIKGWSRADVSFEEGAHGVSVRRFVDETGTVPRILTEVSIAEGSAGVRIVREDADAADASLADEDAKELGLRILRLLRLSDQP